MPTLPTQLFNLVILPLTPPTAKPRLFQFSASRRDGQLRLVSPAWTSEEVHAAFALLATPRVQREELLRGNTRASGRRASPRVYFTTEQLELIGLTPVVSVTTPAGVST